MVVRIVSGIVILLGVCVRLLDVESRSLSHPEMWAPGIQISHDYVSPGERTGLADIFTHTLKRDTHPPGYYMVMWVWMRIAGDSEWAIRLPSVLFGTASLVMVWLLARRAFGLWAAVASVLLLGLNGNHVFWSQVGRMFAMACFLSLASTMLLLRIRRRPDDMWPYAAYVAAMVAGVGTHVFMWPMLAAQIIWVVVADGFTGRPFPRLLVAQVHAAILGSLFLAFAAYQSTNPVAVLSNDLVGYWREFLTLGFLLPTEISTASFQDTVQSLAQSTGYVAARWCAAVLSAILLARFAWRFCTGAKAGDGTGTPDPGGPMLLPLTWVASAAVAEAAIGALVYYRTAALHGPAFAALDPASQALALAALHRLQLCLLAPVAIAAVATVARIVWSPVVKRIGRVRVGERLATDAGLVVWCAVVPVVLLSAASLVRPLLNQRGFLPFVPYLLILFGAGLASMLRRRAVAVATAAALLPLLALSVYSYRLMSVDPADFRELYEKLVPKTASTDLFLMRRGWARSPMVYYLRPERYRLAVSDYDRLVSRYPDSRIWMLTFYDEPGWPEMQAALAGTKRVDEIVVRNARAALHVRQAEPRASR